MSDIDKEVEELLPCTSLTCDQIAFGHIRPCPAYYRPAVAAWARKREAHFMDMVDVYAADAGEKGRRAIALETELAALRQEIERLKAEVEPASEHLHGICAAKYDEKLEENDRLKKAVRKEVGYNPKHCICVFDDSDQPLAECDLHKGMREENERLTAIAAKESKDG